MGPEIPLLIMGFVFLIYQTFRVPIEKLLIKIGCLSKEKEIEVDENLGSYFECITKWDKKKWLAETAYREQKLNFKTMDSW